MVTATERLAKLRRSGMLPGRKFRPMTPPLIGTCRSSGAWLNFGGSAGYKHGAPNGASQKFPHRRCV